MKKKGIGRKIGKRFGKNISKTVVEIFCVVLICSMMLQAAQTMFGGTQNNMSAKADSSYVIEGYVYHPYVNRTVKNATIVFWNLRTEEGNITNTDDNGYYCIDLDEYGISHEPDDQIRILTFYMHYTDNQTITIDSNSTHEVNIKLRNNNHFNNYTLPNNINITIPDTNITIPDRPEYNYTEPDFPEFNYTEYNYTEPELPDFENYTIPENYSKPTPNLTVKRIDYEGIITEGNETTLNIIIENINNETAYNVTAEVYVVKPDSTEEFLGNLSYGDIAPGENKMRPINWIPENGGNVSNIKVVIFSALGQNYLTFTPSILQSSLMSLMIRA